MNGHFSAVGDKPQGGGSYEHGVQVIDEDKEFKYGASTRRRTLETDGAPAART